MWIRKSMSNLTATERMTVTEKMKKSPIPRRILTSMWMSIEKWKRTELERSIPTLKPKKRQIRTSKAILKVN